MKNFRKLVTVAGALLLGATMLLGLCLISLPDGKLHVFVLDIGQGDAILIQTPTSERILIDGGPNDAVLKELGKVMPFYERRIDVMVLTHPHADHVNGLVEVLKRYHVGTVVIAGVNYQYSGYTAFLEQIRKQNVRIVYAGGVSDYRLGAVVLDMLFPFESEQGRDFNNQNNSSIVFRLLYGRRSFYFSGDAEVEVEEKLLAAALNLHADFLKAPHHGSRTSDTVPFLEAVQPEYAAISCGVNNKFHHPHPSTLAHLQAAGAAVFRTDLDGIIEAVSDGETLKFRAWGK